MVTHNAIEIGSWWLIPISIMLWCNHLKCGRFKNYFLRRPTVFRESNCDISEIKNVTNVTQPSPKLNTSNITKKMLIQILFSMMKQRQRFLKVKFGFQKLRFFENFRFWTIFDAFFSGAGKICKNCGEHYLKRHVICLAVLSKTPPKRKSEAEETDYDNMMNEFYLNCPFKMKKTNNRLVLRNDWTRVPRTRT